MFTRTYKSLLTIAALGLILCCAACGPSKQDKEKYHGEIKVVVDKAERNAAFVSKLMTPDTANSDNPATQIANLTAGIEALDKFDADLKGAKSDLAKIAQPKFDDFNLKGSTDKWFDAQIKAMSDMKAVFQELLKAMKLAEEIQNEIAQTGVAPEEKAAQLNKMLDQNNIDKQFRAIEITMHNAKNEVITNEEKFITQNGLNVTKFVVGNL